MSVTRKVCCIRGCSHTSRQKNGFDSVVKFYKFPESTLGVSWKIDKRIKWINAVRDYVNSKDWEPNSFTKICSSHFLNNKKSEHPFHPSYIPTIFPKNEKSNIKKSNQSKQGIQKDKSEETSNNKELMMKERSVFGKGTYRCEMPNCNNVRYRRSNKNAKTFFKFPWESKRYQKWADACQKLVQDLKTENRYICSDHFTKEMMVSPYCKRLKSTAEPVVICPSKENSEDNIPQNKLNINEEDGKLEWLQEEEKNLPEEMTHKEAVNSIHNQITVTKDTTMEELQVTIKKEIDTEEFNAEQYNNPIVDDQQIKEEVIDIVECFKQEIDDLPEEQDIKLEDNSPLDNGSLYNCNLCSKTFAEHSTYSKHILSHELYQCGICNEKFVTPIALMLHLKGHKVNICNLCDMQFQSLTKLQEHKFVICSHREYCELCLSDDKIPKYLLISMEQHYKGVYSCDKCNIQVKTPSQLLYHLLTHFNSKCKNCLIKSGIQQTDQRINKLLFCFKCHLQFKTIAELEQHTLTLHTKSKLYKRRKCLVFKKNIELKNQSLAHKIKTKKEINKRNVNNVRKEMAVGDSGKRKEEEKYVKVQKLDGKIEDVKVSFS